MSALELLLLRHAKSDWSDPGLADFDRPLAKRGRKAAKRVGGWIATAPAPDHVVSSPAVRARETVERVGRRAPDAVARVQWDPRIYEAGVDALLAVLADVPPAARRVLLVGHNPGLEDLLILLCAEGPENGDKLMPTAALAQIEIADGTWASLAPGSASLVGIVRPRDLARARRG